MQDTTLLLTGTLPLVPPKGMPGKTGRESTQSTESFGSLLAGLQVQRPGQEGEEEQENGAAQLLAGLLVQPPPWQASEAADTPALDFDAVQAPQGQPVYAYAEVEEFGLWTQDQPETRTPVVLVEEMAESAVRYDPDAAKTEPAAGIQQGEGSGKAGFDSPAKSHGIPFAAEVEERAYSPAAETAQPVQRPLPRQREDRGEARQADTTPLQVDARPIQAMETGGTQAPVDVQRTDFTEVFADAVAQKTETGGTQFDIDLYPRQLGKVTVTVQIEAGRATLSFLCENARAQGILNAHADDIGTLVQQSTGRETVVSLPEGQQAQNGHDFDGHNGGGQHSGQGRQRPKPRQVELFIDQLKGSMIQG